ncbi:MAG TPA: hypothetical protein VLH81_07635 [Desulfobacterales bacterium]|nr:hypothetical protein [Desulfobacterales bacterium]
MSYVYRPFPKMIHRPGGAQKIVQDATELSDALLQGWSLRPVLAASDPSGWPYPEPAAVPVEPAPDVMEPESDVLVPIEPPLVERSPKKARKARE